MTDRLKNRILPILLLGVLLLPALSGCGASGTAARDYEAALQMLERGEYAEASEAFVALGSYQDSGRLLMYSRAAAAAREGDVEKAGRAFAALGDFQESAGMLSYCDARRLEREESWLEAAETFLQIPDILDSAQRADAARDRIYDAASEAETAGDPERAVSLYASLGDYRDAAERRTDTLRQYFQQRLERRDYEGALLLMDMEPDAITLEHADPSGLPDVEAFLDSFVSAYLYFSANTGDAVSAYYGAAQYLEPGGTLDQRFRQFLMIGSFSHNSGFRYYGGELLDLFRLDEESCLAYFRAKASVLQPRGGVEITRTFRITLRLSGETLVAESIEDCLYGGAVNPTGRPVVSGPLPGGKLPADEDGDGILMLDVWKKGFRGTMMVVLDPSRVFVGFPGFYGGNGMLLDALATRYDALGGINAGGFIDEDGGGSGGLPEGLTIVEGETYLWAASGASAAFDEDNVLHVRYYTPEEAAADRIRDCASFGPALISEGVAEYGPYMESGINPRTAIGQRADGAVLMLCIDGRQLHSIGASYGDIRDVMLDFGAVNACSMDGGSSTVMYFNGEYVNSPSSASGTSRYLPNAFLVRK